LKNFEISPFLAIFSAVLKFQKFLKNPKKISKNFSFYFYCFHQVSGETDEEKPRNSEKKTKIQKF
jgi:hypothetical protein